jgi:hypothetical protein
MVMDNQIFKHFLAGFFPTDDRDLSIFSPLRKALPSFVPQVVFHLRPDMTVTAVNSALEEVWPLRAIECIDVNLSLILSFPDSVADRPRL